MSTDTQQAASMQADRQRTAGSKAILTAGIPFAVLAWMLGTGSTGGGTGGITGDGQWIDADGRLTTVPPETYQVVLTPSPLVLVVALLLLGVAWWTREGRGIPAWLSPVSAVAGILVPIAALVGTWLWIRGFDGPWTLGEPIQGPFWAITTVTIDRME